MYHVLPSLFRRSKTWRTTESDESCAYKSSGSSQTTVPWVGHEAMVSNDPSSPTIGGMDVCSKWRKLKSRSPTLLTTKLKDDISTAKMNARPHNGLDMKTQINVDNSCRQGLVSPQAAYARPWSFSILLVPRVSLRKSCSYSPSTLDRKVVLGAVSGRRIALSYYSVPTFFKDHHVNS